MILICDDVLIEERFFVEAMAQLNAHNRHDVKVIGKACELQYRCIYDLNHTYATRFAPVDGYTPDLRLYHEIKTMVAGKRVNFSPKEKEHADEKLLEALKQAGQIATQYVDAAGNPTMDVRYNPNGSAWAIEGITSADGRILGKMGHSERSGERLYVNVPGNKYQKLFEGGVGYFKV